MVDIEKIVGKKSWIRLQKAGIKTIDQLRALNPEQLMSIAGIGSIKAKKVYSALKISQSTDELDKTYRNLAMRTRFKNIKQKVIETTKSPQEIIGKIEDLREGLTLATNVMRSIGNIGKTTKLPELRYYKIPPVIYPLEKSYLSESPFHVLEIHITPEFDQTKVQTTIYNARTSRIIQDTAEYYPTGSPAEITQKILYQVDDNIKKIGKISDHVDFIIIDPSYDFLEEPLKNKYEREIDAKKITVLNITDKKFYSTTMILNRYVFNKEFTDTINRFNQINLFYEYEDYKRGVTSEETAAPYEQFKKDVGESYDFLNKIKQNLESSVQINKAGQPAAFGIIKGINRNQLWDYQKTHKPTLGTINMSTQLPETYEEWEEEKKPVKIGSKVTTQDLLLLVGYVFEDDFTVWSTEQPGPPVIIQSNKIPDLGLVIY